MAELVVVGLSHHTAPVDVREKLAFPEETVALALKELGALPSIAEVLLLSTCNRVEVYVTARDDAPRAAADVRRYLAAARPVAAEVIETHLYERLGPAAVKHVFRVASSLDSLVIGEPQILGQLKAAHALAAEAGSLGTLLGRCLERAFGVAKRVRSETSIARGAASVSSVAVDLAQRVFGELEGKQVLVIGAGKMSSLAARKLADEGVAELLVINRSPEKAAALAAEIGGKARPWESLPELLAAADVVISSTGAQRPIIDRALMKQTVKARRHRPLFVIDIAVPRDVEPEAGKLDGVYLFDIDDLERVVAENRKGRERESSTAEHIVDAEAAQFLAWQRAQAAVPVIKELRERFQGVAAAEAQKAIAAAGASPSPEALQRLAESIVAKLLHKPLMAIKQDDGLAQAARRLFDLGETKPEKEKP